MGKGKAKSKKLPVKAIRDDNGSGEEEKAPPSKKRGRPPTRTLKNDTEDEEQAGSVEEDEESAKANSGIKDVKNQTCIENGKKRKVSVAQVNEIIIKDENAIETEENTDDSLKQDNFRQHRSRRKSTPRRAPVPPGVQCM